MVLRRTAGGRTLLGQLEREPEVGVSDKVLAVPPLSGPGSAQRVAVAVVAVVDQDVATEGHLGQSTNSSRTWSQN